MQKLKHLYVKFFSTEINEYEMIVWKNFVLLKIMFAYKSIECS